MNLLSLVCYAPVAGITKRDRSTVHAITLEAGMDAILKGRLAVAACGKKHVWFYGTKSGENDPGGIVVWPIRARGDLTRCRECWIATGKKPPRRPRS